MADVSDKVEGVWKWSAYFVLTRDPNLKAAD